MTAEATVLVVEDDAPLLDALASALEDAGLAVLRAADGGAALDTLDRASVDLVVSDVEMRPMDGRELLRRTRERHPHVPLLLMTAYGTVEQAVAALHEGAVDYLVKPFEAEELERRVRRYLPRAAGGQAAGHGAGSSGAIRRPSGPLAADPRSRNLLELAERVAASDVTVLLTGESGTGKEVYARYIHACSSRSAAPFVAVNCAAIPAEMLEALLFGHEKGAFTGAQTRGIGKFVQANGGTLLLDEITEMALGLQAKLLRVLQEREVEPLGAAKPIALDVRVLATSNRDLSRAVAEGAFREDLYYRLSVFPLEIPPLRERRGDIVPLAERFVAARHAGPGEPPALTAATRTALESYAWPGNVRQLENVMQRALVLCGAEPAIEPRHLALESHAAPAAPAVPPSGGLAGELWEEEARRIVQALAEARGRRQQAAERLGISGRTLRYKLSKLRAAGVELPGDRPN